MNELLRAHDELAAHVWRVPVDERPAFLRALFNMLGPITGVFR